LLSLADVIICNEVELATTRHGGQPSMPSLPDLEPLVRLP
jgi:hypothetical protein